MFRVDRYNIVSVTLNLRRKDCLNYNQNRIQQILEQALVRTVSNKYWNKVDVIEMNYTESQYKGDLSNSTVGLEMEDSSTVSELQGRRRDCFGNIRFVLKLMGMSLEKKLSTSYKIYSLVFIFIPLFSYPFTRILDLFFEKGTNVYDRILIPYPVIVAFGKSMVLLWNRVKLTKLLDKLEQEPYLPNPNRGNEVEEENLQKNCMKIIKTQSIIYMGTTIAIITLLTIESLIKKIISEDYHDWEFPYGRITLLNVTHSPNYELWWFYESYSIYILGTHFIVIDTIVAAVLTYLTFQFKMLQNNIKRIIKMSYNEMLMETRNIENAGETSVVDASIIPWKYLKKSLIRTIDYHLAVLSVAAETEEVFNGFLLFVFLNTLGLLGVLVGNTTTITRGGACVVSGQVFISCFWGQQLMHESQEVGRVAFETNFVGADLRFQKSLALIIRRCQNPVLITAGKFAAVSLSTFTWILRAGYSASTVLQQVQK